MKRYISLIAVGLGVIVSVNSCSVASLALYATSLALGTASLVGHSALLAHDLTTYVGSHKTAYTFELVELANDGGIGGGKILHPTADNQYRAEFKDDLIDFTFCYKYNCIVPAFKGCTNSYRTLPLYVSQKKADESNLVGQTFTLTFPIINVDKVITYTATIKINSITVN